MLSTPSTTTASMVSRTLVRCREQGSTVARLVRYSAVSVVSTATSLAVLGILVGMAGCPAAWSNVVATAIGTIPSFELNRRWVWSSQGPRSFARQVVPFCALSFSGLVLSTLAVACASQRTVGWGQWAHTLAVEGANLAAYGSLWVVQYVVLDRVLFGRATPQLVDGTEIAFTADQQRTLSSDRLLGPMLSVGAESSTGAIREGSGHDRR
jgi:putative flippase GtrA